MRSPLSSCHVGRTSSTSSERAQCLASRPIQCRGNPVFRRQAWKREAPEPAEVGRGWRPEPKNGSIWCRMSSPPSHCAARVGLLLALAGVGAVGCGATGLDWVAESETPPRSSDHEYLAAPRAPEPGPVTAATEQEPAAEAHPRLSRTVTLGEIDVAPVAQGPAPVAGPGVSVTINNYTSTGSSGAGYGYAGFGYARSQPSFSRGAVNGASRSSSSGPQAGQNWPSIADHGSSFPYRSAPASPWARTQ
jgi:hypothetical protein